MRRVTFLFIVGLLSACVFGKREPPKWPDKEKMYMSMADIVVDAQSRDYKKVLIFITETWCSDGDLKKFWDNRPNFYELDAARIPALEKDVLFDRDLIVQVPMLIEFDLEEYEYLGIGYGLCGDGTRQELEDFTDEVNDYSDLFGG